MNYKELLNTKTDCPFCRDVSDRVIVKGENSFLTYALAPYAKHHLLIVPDRHIEDYEDINERESKDIEHLLQIGIKLIKKLGHKNYVILLRNGENIGKTIKHLHYHIIPSTQVESVGGNSIERKILTEEEIKHLINEFKEVDLS
jgi:diadenosine tetraphosphate (Ap4A) HIT family hydrolase